MHWYERIPAVTAAGLLLGVPTIVDLPDVSAAAADTCKGREATIEGTGGDDDLVGTPDDDVIRAYAGDDVIDGRGGDDVICGDSGADELTGGEGDDVLYGGPYKLYSADGDNAATGDVLIGGSGDDRIVGGGTSSNEAVNVSPANLTPDRVEFPEAHGGVTMTDEGVVTGPGIGRDVVTGVAHIVGTDWADDITVRGRAIVSGGDGPDRIRVVGGGRDLNLTPTLEGDAGRDRLDLSRSGVAGYWLYGGAGDDVLIGSEQGDNIGDQDGAGTADGRGGDDQLDVTSRMSVSGGSGDDTMHVALETGPRQPLGGGAGRDHAELQNRTAAPLSIDVPSGLVRVDGKESGLAGIESFGASARAADVRFVGGASDEKFGVVTSREHTVRAWMGGGDDYFAAYAAIDTDDQGTATAWGGPGNDVFDGAESGDSMFGEAGNDRMYGDTGDDVLRGGPGTDRAYGSRGEPDSCRAEVEQSCED